MAKIGSFGEVIFEITDDKILSFDKLIFSKKAKWAKHDTINVKSRAEYLGDGELQTSLSIKLRAFDGVHPQNELDKLDNIISNGLVEALIIGSKVYGDFYLESMNFEPIKVDGKGVVWQYNVDLSLSEYCKDKYEDVKKRVENAKKKQSQRG